MAISPRLVDLSDEPPPHLPCSYPFSPSKFRGGKNHALIGSRNWKVHGRHWILVTALHLLPLGVFPADAADALSLNQTLNLAEQRSTLLRTTCSTYSTVEGELNDTRAPLWNNPEITMEHRRRQLFQAGSPDTRRTDNGIGISQTFELGGQQGARRSAAESSVEAVKWAIANTRREVRTEAATRFIELLAAQERVRINERALEILQRGEELVAKRVEAGEESRLDGNLAQVEAERGANQLALAKEQLTQAHSALAMLLQLDMEDVRGATGNLDGPSVPYTLKELLDAAARRPKLQVFEAKAKAAQHRLELERGAVYPDLTVGLSYSPERGIDGQDRITTLSFSLPLPLFRRNSSGIGRALTELDQATIERQSAEQITRTDVTTLWQRFESLRQRMERLRRAVLPSLEENQKLSLKALQAGEIGLPQFLLVRRQLLDSELDLLGARVELRVTRIALENSAGWPEALEPLVACVPETRP